MLEQARQKLLDEMKNNKDDDLVQVAGNYVLERIEMDPEYADLVLKPDKTLVGCIDKMAKVAKSRAKGKNHGGFAPAEGFAMILEYFDIPMARTTRQDPVVAPPPAPRPAAFEVNLDDLLEG